ncbi:ER membrane protein complex subunit 10 [Lucilia cuprina]|uniref:ER membrane protein complex subunit 10 n=1 Tax=Lucilia cuprina TaxID=7375 RepID=UPI001F050BD1|nr:ER membrane protein complex subunit 10 [Lucilia cuprina]
MKVNIDLFLSSIFLLGLFNKSHAYLEFDGWISIELQHALNPNEQDNFSYRGNISVPSLNSGLFNIAQNVLTKKDLDNLRAISVSDGFYRLKAVVEYPNGLKRTFFTANKACNLLSSQLNDELWISIDANGYVNALSLSTSDGDFTDCSTLDFSNLSITEFNTEVLIKHTELAPIPDTASFIQKIEREREARERGENKDNRGFFAKYWMYIVPVVLLVFISGATNPEQQK